MNKTPLYIAEAVALITIGAVSIGALVLSYRTHQELKTLESTFTRLPLPSATNQPDPQTAGIEERLQKLEQTVNGVKYEMREHLSIIDATTSPTAVDVHKVFTLEPGQSTTLRREVSIYAAPGTASYPTYIEHPVRLHSVKSISDVNGTYYEITLTFDGNRQTITFNELDAYPYIDNDEYVKAARPRAYGFKSPTDRTPDVHGSSDYLEIIIVKDNSVYFRGITRSG